MKILSVEALNKTSCCEGPVIKQEPLPPRQNQCFVKGFVDTAVGAVPCVSSAYTWRDRLGSWKARWAIGRMNYTVDPGLYALGQPGADSPALVTANYKMTFDRLRSALPGLNAWILVLDTKGINVWCAAGKGTFSTEEVVFRVKASRISEIVSHRTLILPQLGAPGVAAYQVKERTGFKVVYGPVEARDLAAFIKEGFKATEGMRKKAFPAVERLVLSPIEIIGAIKIAAPAFVGLFLLSLLLGGFSWPWAVQYSWVAFTAFGSSILAGAILTPSLLPWLPGRAFSLKGFVAGLLVFALILLYFWSFAKMDINGLLTLFFWIPAMSAYGAMNFTGCSTYTSLTGVRREMRWALPLELGGIALGLVTWIIGAVSGR